MSQEETKDCVEAAMESESWHFTKKAQATGRERGYRSAEEFQAGMRRIQARLIQCHLPAMDAQTQARAERTLCWLDGTITADQAVRP